MRLPYRLWLWMVLGSNSVVVLLGAGVALELRNGLLEYPPSYQIEVHNCTGLSVEDVQLVVTLGLRSPQATIVQRTDLKLVPSQTARRLFLPADNYERLSVTWTCSGHRNSFEQDVSFGLATVTMLELREADLGLRVVPQSTPVSRIWLVQLWVAFAVAGCLAVAILSAIRLFRGRASV